MNNINLIKYSPDLKTRIKSTVLAQGQIIRNVSLVPNNKASGQVGHGIFIALPWGVLVS